MSNFKDLTGNRYFRIKVISLNREKSDEMGALYWNCECDCGNKMVIAGYSLKRGNIKSCGCWNREQLAQRNRERAKSNKIEFDENLGCYRGYFNTVDDSFLFSVEDLDVVSQNCWFKNKNGYAESIRRGDKKHTHVLMHRLILSKYEDIEGYEVDHTNHNPLDNRNFNLRKADHEENMKNRRPYSNTGERYISFNGRLYKLYLPNRYYNSYTTIEEAKKVRDEYLSNNPEEFRYDPILDHENRKDAIYPFRFIDPNSIIKPFIEVDKDK